MTAPLYAEAGRRGLVIPLAPFRARLGGSGRLQKVLKALSVTEKVHAGCPRGMAHATRKAYTIDRCDGEHLIIPRLKGPPFLRALSGGRPLLDGIRAAADAHPPPRQLAAERCEPEEPLYGYQEAAVAYLCGDSGPLGAASVAAFGGVAYLQMDTGLGKSRVGLAVIARRGEPALIVVPTQAIADQWVDEAGELYPQLCVGVYHNPPKGSRKVPPSPRTHDVVVVVVNTFREKDPSFVEGFGTVVLDEAHEYHSAHNSRALWLAQTRAVLGLSATPEGRPDGLDRYVHLHLGPAIGPKMIPGFDAGAVHFVGEVRAVEYAGHPDHCETATTPAGTMSAVLTIGNIIEDGARLQLVAAEVERLYRLHETASAEELLRLGLGPRPASAATPTHPAGEVRRHGVFVFAEHREYLPVLRSALLAHLHPEELCVPELDAREKAPRQISLLRGGVSKAEVGRTRRAGAHIVLTTYGFSRRGISLPEMTAIVSATPRRHGFHQILGRILRRGSDESIVRQVVDIVDVRTGLKGQFSDRRRVYGEKGYPVSSVAVSWEAFATPDGGHGPLPTGAPSLAPTDAAGALDSELAGMAADELLALALGEG